MPTLPRITWQQALAWRLGRHLLDPVGEPTAGEVVGRLGAVLAMDEGLADLAMRARGAPAGDLARAVEDGEVVIGFTFRGALHHLAAEDGGIYSSIRTASRQWELPSWVDYYRLRPEDWPDFRATVRGILKSRGPLTIPELGEALAGHRAYRHLRPVFDEGAVTLIKPLSWQGDLSLGLRRDGARKVQSLETNPRWGGVPDLDEAGPRAVTAYVGTYGPVTRDHVEHWFADNLSAGRKRLLAWFNSLDDVLTALDVEGETAYVLREHLDGVRAAEPSEAVRFLPGHDQWVMGVGTKDEHVTPPPLRELMTRKANAIVQGGAVRGTWARTRDGVSVDWLHGKRPPQKLLNAEIDRVVGATVTA